MSAGRSDDAPIGQSHGCPRRRMGEPPLQRLRAYRATDTEWWGTTRSPLSRGRPITHPSRAAQFVRHKLRDMVRRAPQVMVKLARAPKGLRGISNNLSYISRDGQLDIEDQDGQIITGNREDFRSRSIPPNAMPFISSCPCRHGPTRSRSNGPPANSRHVNFPIISTPWCCTRSKQTRTRTRRVNRMCISSRLLRKKRGDQKNVNNPAYGSTCVRVRYQRIPLENTDKRMASLLSSSNATSNIVRLFKDRQVHGRTGAARKPETPRPSACEIRYSMGLQQPPLVAWSAHAVSPTIKSSRARKTTKSPGLLSGRRR